ncbi:MAG TPA: class I adenylate-forming enzyme family protein [Deltaproteobacteria bacterium]|nr:class I adenylate-forming enzyme family protein [Deltaproteobacteria bacterium]
MRVCDLLTSSAQKAPERTALLHGDRSVSYGELEGLSNRIARLLAESGLEPGDRVLVVMENSMESAAAYYGILKAGCVSVEIHDRTTPSEAQYYVKNSGAKACILSRTASSRLSDIDAEVVLSQGEIQAVASRIVIPWAQIEAMDSTRPDISVPEDALAAIVYTSGSTGAPKGVMLSHRNLCTNTAAIVSYLGLTSADRVMAVLPFYYVYGKTLLNTHVMAGGSVVINNRFAFPNAVIKEMVDKEVTGFAGVPSTFAILMNRSIFPSTTIPTLRYVTQAGGAMAPALTRRVIEHLKGVPLFVMYGATEASARLTYLPPDRLVTDKLGSIGIPIPGVEVTVRDDQGNVLGHGEVGNICAQGPNIMQGYWQDPDETAKALKPWGLVTGDLGHKDAEGFIFLTGRKKEMLKIGGERVSPKEIEDAIIASGMVHESAVIGHPDELLSEVPAAFVVPLGEDGFHLAALQRYIAGRLAPHKHPKYWHVLRAMPKKPSGKIDKEALKHELLHKVRTA